MKRDDCGEVFVGKTIGRTVFYANQMNMQELSKENNGMIDLFCLLGYYSNKNYNFLVSGRTLIVHDPLKDLKLLM